VKGKGVFALHYRRATSTSRNSFSRSPAIPSPWRATAMERRQGETSLALTDNANSPRWMQYQLMISCRIGSSGAAVY